MIEEKKKEHHQEEGEQLPNEFIPNTYLPGLSSHDIMKQLQPAVIPRISRSKIQKLRNSFFLCKE